MVHPKTKPYASARMGAYAVKGGRALTSRRAETRCFSVLENVQRTNPNGFFTPPNPDCARPPPRKPLVCVKLTVFTPYMPSVRPNFLCPAKFRQRNGRRITLKRSLILDGTSQTGSRPLLGQACHHSHIRKSAASATHSAAARDAAPQNIAFRQRCRKRWPQRTGMRPKTERRESRSVSCAASWRRAWNHRTDSHAYSKYPNSPCVASVRFLYISRAKPGADIHTFPIN